MAARRMHTRLPSFSGEFRVSTPLTRIRDIAHRNDIPKELKVRRRPGEGRRGGGAARGGGRKRGRAAGREAAVESGAPSGRHQWQGAVKENKQRSNLRRAVVIY